MLYRTVYYLCLMLTAVAGESQYSNRTDINVVMWTRCDEHYNLSSFMKNSTNDNITVGDNYSGFVELVQPIPDGITIYMYMARQPSDDTGTAGQEYPETILSDLCQKIGKKYQAWTPFVESFHDLSPKCPLDEGVYHFQDAPIPDLGFTNMEGGSWTISFKIMLDDKSLYCSQAWVKIYHYTNGVLRTNIN